MSLGLRLRWAVLILLLATVLPGRAIEWVRMESKVLNHGWFEYRLTVFAHPFVPQTQFFGANVPTTNTLEAISPPGWTNSIDTWSTFFGWNNTPNTSPYELVFLLRSSATHYRSNTVTTTLALDLTDLPGMIVGYINFPALVPCSEAEADVSPKTMVFTLNVGEIVIDDLLRTNNQVYGVKFSHPDTLTVELQGTHNLKDWDAIARFHASPPVTTWTTNSYLNSKGKFFRLAMVAKSHIPLSRTAERTGEQPAERARVIRCLPGKDTIEVELETQPGASYQVLMREYQGTGVQEQKVAATSEITRVSFPQMGTGAVLFDALRMAGE